LEYQILFHRFGEEFHHSLSQPKNTISLSGYFFSFGEYAEIKRKPFRPSLPRTANPPRLPVRDTPLFQERTPTGAFPTSIKKFARRNTNFSALVLGFSDRSSEMLSHRFVFRPCFAGRRQRSFRFPAHGFSSRKSTVNYSYRTVKKSIRSLSDGDPHSTIFSASSVAPSFLGTLLLIRNGQNIRHEGFVLHHRRLLPFHFFIRDSISAWSFDWKHQHGREFLS
jgi:hypothetical protein